MPQSSSEYDISLFYEDNLFETASTNYNYIMSDSIHKMFPTSTLSLADLSGEYREALISIVGMRYGYKMGSGDEYLQSSYVIVDDEMIGTGNAQLLSGDIKIGMIHDLYNRQDLVSKRHEDRISNIVRSITNKYNFRKVVIDGTSNDTEWFQFQKRDIDFIIENLMPFAFSYDAENSPFYCFIDVNNEFHFRSYKSMWNSTPITTLTLTGSNNDIALTQDGILSIQPFRENLSVYRNLQKRNITGISSSGAMSTSEDAIYNYPSNTKKIPVKADKSLYTGTVMLPDERTLYKGMKENVKGFYTQKMAKGMLLDKYIVTIPFNPLLRSGRLVNLAVPEMDDSSQNRLIVSGTYLIEHSDHIWADEKAFTNIVVGRKDTNITSQYTVKDKLLGN